MKDPDAPLTDVEVATVSLFLGDLSEWRTRTNLGLKASSPTKCSFTKLLSLQRLQALRYGALHWLESCSPHIDHRGPFCPAIHVHQIHPTPSYEGEATRQTNFSLWKNRDTKSPWCYETDEIIFSMMYNAGFPCGLCWVTFGEEVTKHARPVNANLMWSVIPTEAQRWSLHVKYETVFHQVFGEFDPAYYRDWWTTPGMQAYGYGDPDQLLTRFHEVSGLHPNMVENRIKSALDEGAFE